MSYHDDVPAHPDPEKDEPVSIPLDFETALKGLLAVDPDGPVEERGADDSPPKM